MDSVSEPVAAAAAYDLVISEELTSDESGEPHEREVDKDIPLVSTTLPTLSSTQSMENVLLDTLPMDESIDLGSESVLNQSVHSVTSVPRLDEEALPETDNSSIKTDQLVSPNEASPTDDTGKNGVHFDDIVSPPDEVENEHSTEDLLDGNKGSSFAHGSTNEDDMTGQVSEIHSEVERIVTFSEEKLSEPDDAREVEFVEEKGLQPAESSRSLCKFFDNGDNVGGTDVEGKSFFDSFTTGDEDPITSSGTVSPKIVEPLPTLPPLSMPHVSLSSSVSSVGATPSPVHRISDPSSPFSAHHRNSVNEGSISEADPFSAGVFTNDTDRRHDAWIPSESTPAILVSVLTNTPDAALPAHSTCSPHIIFEESLVCTCLLLCESIVLTLLYRIVYILTSYT